MCSSIFSGRQHCDPKVSLLYGHADGRRRATFLIRKGRQEEWDDRVLGGEGGLTRTPIRIALMTGDRCTITKRSRQAPCVYSYIPAGLCCYISSSCCCFARDKDAHNCSGKLENNIVCLPGLGAGIHLGPGQSSLAKGEWSGGWLVDG